jgi:hypothetical protein
VHWVWRIQSLPIDTGDEPLPLVCAELEGRGVYIRPGELAAMQTTLAEPDAGAIPDQQFETIVAPVSKCEGAAIAR